jgi:GT2 family glycosyltransferase
MGVSVVICAYTLKRWSQLELAVNSALAQPDAEEVILVIDHNEELYSRAVTKWPQVYVLENTRAQGLSGARNTALDEALGTKIAFLDDDATADERWLAELIKPFDADADVIAVGGTAVPVWPNGEASRFLPEELLWVVGCSFDGQAKELEEVRNIMGCSMLFSTAALRGVGGFNESTGRIGTRPLGAEETEACILLKKQNPAAKIMFQPTSVVRHHVSEDRMNLKYVLRRGYYEGISKAHITANLAEKSGNTLSTERAYTFQLLGKIIKYALTGRFTHSFSLFGTLFATILGYVRGTLGLKFRKVPSIKFRQVGLTQ